jgi:hypothetical protein
MQNIAYSTFGLLWFTQITILPEVTDYESAFDTAERKVRVEKRRI